MKGLKQLAYRLPFVPALHRALQGRRFPGSRSYWEERYAAGLDSGTGSAGPLARFKAEFLNGFVRERGVRSVIEFGCGDGAQLAPADYPSYIGLDVSRTALARCIDRFQEDRRKSFFLYDSKTFVDHGRRLSAELALSLEVVFHLVEDEVYRLYMTHLFQAADRFVIVYSSNGEGGQTAPHVRHRRFTDWVSKNASDWQLVRRVENPYPFDPARPDETAFSEFFVFEKSTE